MGTDTDTGIEVRPADPHVLTEPPKVAHIVKVDSHESGLAKVTEARVNGTPLEALCGAIFVPSQDPTKLPRCEPCQDAYKMYVAIDNVNPDVPT